MKPHNDTLFQEPKAAQAAAFMLYKANGKLEVLKLMKLMYLAERESFARFGEGLTGDAFRTGGQHGLPTAKTGCLPCATQA